MKSSNAKFIDVLKQMFDTYGQDLINDSARVNALLMDLAPGNSKERKLICSVLREGIGSELIKVVDKSENEQKHCITKCIIQIKNDTWIAEEAAEFAIQIIANSIGISCEVAAPDRKKKAPSSQPENRTIIKGMFSGDSRNLSSALMAYDEIGYKAFAANTELTEVLIPESIKSIKSRAFQNCINLAKVQLPANLDSIGGCVFCGCSALESITIPQSRKFAVVNGMLVNKEKKSLIRSQNEKGKNECQIPGEISVIEPYAFDRSPVRCIKIPKSTNSVEYDAFTYCMELEKFDVDPHNASFASVDGVLHSKSLKQLLRYPSGNKKGNYIIEDEVEEIADSAFSGAAYLETVTFTNSLKSIGSKAFEKCLKIESLMLPACVEVIGERAFQFCDKLANVMLPRSIKEIGDFAFYDCASIQSLSVPQNVQRIGHAAFKGCSGLQKIVIQGNVSFIGDGAFEGCSSNLEVCIRNNQYVESYCRARGIKFSKI